MDEELQQLRRQIAAAKQKGAMRAPVQLTRQRRNVASESWLFWLCIFK